MIFSHNDALVSSTVKEEKGSQQVHQNEEKSKVPEKPQRFLWKPFHVVLIIYGFIAATGILFSISN